MLVNAWECKYSFGKAIYYKIRYASGLYLMLKMVQLVKLTFARYQFSFVMNMTFLLAHNRAAACPLLGLSQIKVNNDASWKTYSDMY